WRLWDAGLRNERAQPLRPPGGMTMLQGGGFPRAAWGPDGKTVLLAGQSGTSQLFDVDTGRARGAPIRHDAEGTAVTVSPDGTTVGTASSDRTVRLWDAATGAPRCKPLRHEGRVWAAAFGPDGQTLVTCGEFGGRLWDTAKGTPLGDPLSHKDPVYSV